ncbi:MAG: glutamate-5-semialdehyde dehydrogenase [Rikenellaceae bacterium]|nr:glutamate-5-semialdehyde dehydrogenase [Rikenellaceae bacterium]
MNLNGIFERAVEASRAVQLLDEERIDRTLRRLADEAVRRREYILSENAKDLARMEPADPMYDRLLLTPERIEGIAADMRNVASLASPVGETLSETVRPNGMTIRKVRVPFGVIGAIYEARPNVSFDIFGLCFKTQNASALKGGKNAQRSNEAIVRVIKDVLKAEGIDENVVTLLPAERDATAAMLGAVGYIDLIIPRGSASLIEYVRDNSRIPVIETGAGVCHAYFDRAGDTAMGAGIVFNAKTRRPSVCNTLDTLIVHSSRLQELPALCEKLATGEVTIYADDRAHGALKDYPRLQKADENSFGTEFLSLTMSVKTVDSLDEALEHIARHGSRHSESIITDDAQTARDFLRRVDAACVYHNVSTAFTDGAQFGFGAEIGISTQKLHARGPMALPELTSYKYIIEGNGQTRS